MPPSYDNECDRYCEAWGERNGEEEVFIEGGNYTIIAASYLFLGLRNLQ